MKKILLISMSAVITITAITIFAYRKEIKMLYTSLNSFKDENLAYTFQHMYEIQPSKKISKGASAFKFKRDLTTLPETFTFEGKEYQTKLFLEDTKTSGFLVIKNDAIKFEQYYLGSNEDTRLSSNSMGKSVVSALMGIAVDEGFIDSIEDPLSKYIPEFRNTQLADIPIKACLQMASGINFDEETDMSTYSMRTLLGTPAMKLISKKSLQEAPYTTREYLSINTEILGEIIVNATGRGLADYLEEKIWKKIGVEHDAYWTLSNDKELAMGGLCISLRDYARFARLYLNNGNWQGEQIIPAQWIRDTFDISAPYSKPGANDDSYNDIGYGYQWWIPEGNQGEFMAIGVYSQWIYVSPEKGIIIVKTSADPDFNEETYELKHLEFFREVANNI